MSQATQIETRRFQFILQPEFPVSALILATEALRIANQNSGRIHFAWRLASEDGREVRASNGMWFAVDTGLDYVWPSDVCLIMEGNLPTQHVSRRLLGYLRKASRFGAVVGGIDTGAFVLMQAGLLNESSDSEVVVHWEAAPAFRERFPTVQAANRLFLGEDAVVSTAGGVATLDLILHLVARFRGEAMANEVANALVHSRREGAVPQRTDQDHDLAVNSVASRLVRVMEQNLDFPLTLDELSERVGTPKRSLARITNSVFGIAPVRLYLRVRLQAARNLLFYEEHAIRDIATTCGFSYPTAFSRAFRAQFGLPPSEFRRNLRQSQVTRVQPELHRLISSGAGVEEP